MNAGHAGSRLRNENGAHLARLEMRVMFDEVTRRLNNLELAGPVERLRSNTIAGIKRMPIRFKPAAAPTR